MAKKLEGTQECNGQEQNDYYDIMIIGQTGAGKSTTTDKLLIANPEGIHYTVDSGPAANPDTKQLNCGDITMWMTSTKDFSKEQTRLKSLVFARTDKAPHQMINRIRKNEGSESTRTVDCEVFSNETSKLRILDVPGFFDEDSLMPTNGGEQGSVHDSQANATMKNLAIMRKILRIQTVMNMKFRRILYFLPNRGPLKRANGVLQLELQAMTHYFGTSMLKKLVVVATNSPTISELKIPEEQVFPKEACDETKRHFVRALEKLFPKEKFPEFHLIYISLSETCESISKKIKDAGDDSYLRLELNPETCGKCGKHVGIVKGERVACYIRGEDKVPYDESTCHPKLVPDYRFKHRFAEFFLKLFTLGKKSLADFLLLDEMCAGCNKPPGNPGCMRVGETFLYKGANITVDHKCSTLSVVERQDFQQMNPVTEVPHQEA